MNDHIKQEQLDRYRERLLEPSELLMIDDHLAECEDCRGQLRKLAPAIDSLLLLRANLQTQDNSTSVHHREVEIRSDSIIKKLGDWISSTMKQTLPPTIPGLAWAGAIVILLVVSFSLWNRLRLKPQNEIAQERIKTITNQREEVPSNQTLQPTSPPAEPLLALNDGKMVISLDDTGRVSGLESLPSTDRRMIETVLTSGKIASPAIIPQLAGASGVLMGDEKRENTFRPVSPVGKVVNTPRPVFRWEPLPGATGYKVSIYDTEFNEIVVSPTLQTSSWQSSIRLNRGGIYIWQITAYLNDKEIRAPGPSESEAKFKVLEQSTAIRLDKAKREYSDRHLVLGTFYAQAGLLEEAEKEFSALVADNPESPLAVKLLHDIRMMRFQKKAGIK